MRNSLWVGDAPLKDRFARIGQVDGEEIMCAEEEPILNGQHRLRFVELLRIPPIPEELWRVWFGHVDDRN